MTSNSKGFSSIVGAVFAALVMISLISTVFVWSLSQNTLYNNAVRQSNLADLDRSNENIVTVDPVTCNRINDSWVSVNGTLENDGPLSVQIVALWVVDATPPTNYNHTALNIVLTPGSAMNLSDTSAIDVALPNSEGDSLSCWFISARGNTIPKNLATTTIYINATSTTYADVSSGIGLLAFNFKEFSNIDLTAKLNLGNSAPANHTLLPPFEKNYWLRQDHYTIFHVILTNYDPAKADMVLNSSSTVYILAAQGGTVKFGFYPLVNVTGNAVDGLYVNSALPGIYTLPWDVPVDVYFLGKPGISALTAGVYPLNIMAFGTLGTGDYGQNVPFVSMNVLS